MGVEARVRSRLHRSAIPPNLSGMLGAIVGDVVGSVFEGSGFKSKHFPLLTPRSRFTDDTVLTIATAHALLRGLPYAETYRDFSRRFPDAGYGAGYLRWMSLDDPSPYGSWGNGSAMRVSPVGWRAGTLDEALAEAEASARVTHDHPEGVKGARAVAGSIFIARSGGTKPDIREFVEHSFSYDVQRRLDDIRVTYRFDASCQNSVPEALIAFLEAESFEDALRNAVSLGGDADTQACIAGAVAEPYFGGVPPGLAVDVRRRLPPDLATVVDAFNERIVKQSTDAL